MSGRDFLLFALFVALIAAGGGGQCAWAQSEPRYPSWFHTTPSGTETLWAIGYGPAYSDLHDGMPAAKNDAYESLRRAVRVVVIGEKLYEAAPGYATAVQGERFVETGLPDTLRAVTYVDSLRAGDMTLVLAAWSESGSSARATVSRARSAFSKKPPSWVEQALEGGGTDRQAAQRAVGIAPRYYNLETSWERAEKRARRTLAFRVATKVKSLDKSTQDYRHNVRSMTTGVDLRDVQVRARWADEENCYVLVSARVADVLLK
mgnify:CR=1 FL=1